MHQCVTLYVYSNIGSETTVTLNFSNDFAPFHPQVNFKELYFSNIDFSSKIENIILEMRPLIEQGREYSYLAASLLCEELRLEISKSLQLPSSRTNVAESEKKYPNLQQYVEFG